MSRCIVMVSVVALLASGCTMLKANTEQVRDPVTPSKNFVYVTYSEASELIKRYEKEPGHEKELASLYAARSVLQVHHLPTLEYSPVHLDNATETPSLKQMHYLLTSPIAIVLDIVTLPYKGVQTLFVTDEDIQNALLNLGKARSLGYTQDVHALDWFFEKPLGKVNPTHLDVLGYQRNEVDP